MCVRDDVRATYVLQLYHARGETASDSPQQTTEYCNREITQRDEDTLDGCRNLANCATLAVLSELVPSLELVLQLEHLVHQRLGPHRLQFVPTQHSRHRGRRAGALRRLGRRR